MAVDRRPALLAVAALLAIPALCAAELPITLQCSSDVYALGETVRMVWTNGTDSTLVTGATPPYDIWKLDTGEWIFSGPYTAEYHLPPHEADELAWDQRDNSFEPVPPGRYLIRISYWFNEGLPGGVVVDEFTILEPAAVPEDGAGAVPSSWGRVKALFGRH